MELETFMHNIEEERFLLDAITKKDIVLEWGSGKSTLAITKRANQIISIESNLMWYNRIAPTLPENAKIFYIPRNSEEAAGHDGTYENYKDYIEFPISLNINPTIVFIDGRARVECARVAAKAYPNATIYIHDFANPEYAGHEYEGVNEFLKKTGQENALARFIVK